MSRSGSRRWLAGVLLVAVTLLISSCGHSLARGGHGHRNHTRSSSSRSARASAPNDGRGDASTALLSQVRAELAAMRRTGYQHTTDVRPATGEYYYDCSGLLDYALARSAPADLEALPITTSVRPLAEDFEHHLTAVAQGGVQGSAQGSVQGSADGPWQPVRAASELRPGDVVSWLKPPTSTSTNTGHVMVVDQAATRNPARPTEWLVKVIDSTTGPHAQDSRSQGTDGLGTGTIGLQVDDSGAPTGFYWQGGVTAQPTLTQIALGRPG
ncbi:MAG TPA: hypothetical protein VH141_05130 [Pseudonocardia sp.]|jgi:hypothetical protein|nr:hypothetical protein [Pseudonocardia sp.]